MDTLPDLPRYLRSFFWDRHRFTGIKLVNDLEESVDVRWEKRFLLNEHHVASIAPVRTSALLIPRVVYPAFHD